MRHLHSGYVSMMLAAYPDGQPSVEQRRDMKRAFMAGALTMSGLILQSAEPPNEADHDRMISVYAELEAFPHEIETARELDPDGT